MCVVTASVVGAGTVTAPASPTPASARKSRIRPASTSSPSEPTNWAVPPSRATPTATLSGPPPIACRNTGCPSHSASNRSISASPSTTAYPTSPPSASSSGYQAGTTAHADRGRPGNQIPPIEQRLLRGSSGRDGIAVPGRRGGLPHPLGDQLGSDARGTGPWARTADGTRPSAPVGPPARAATDASLTLCGRAFAPPRGSGEKLVLRLRYGRVVHRGRHPRLRGRRPDGAARTGRRARHADVLGSRTYLCWQDGSAPPARSGRTTRPAPPPSPRAAPTPSTTGSAARSDAGGRTVGFIPDGKLCSGGNTVSPVTFPGPHRLAADPPDVRRPRLDFKYSNWATTRHFVLFLCDEGQLGARPAAGLG